MGSPKFDKAILAQKIQGMEGLNKDDKSALLALINRVQYGLAWEDRPESVEEKLKQYLPYFKEVSEKRIISDTEDAPNHLIIESDNLPALVALSYAYDEKVDLIYIDPPYNTGNKDFTYNDRYVDKENAFRHSSWLSFMEKRLLIAKRLLKKTGSIFISIDDNELAQLKLLCDRIFPGGFIANLVWKSKSGGANDSRFFAVDHEYVLVYAKDPNSFFLNKDPEATVTTSYNRRDEKGEYSLDRLDKQSIRYSDSLNYEIIGPDGKSYWPKHKDPAHPNATWRWSKEHVMEEYDKLVFENGCVYTKNYKKEGAIARSLLLEDRFGRTRTGKTDCYAVLGTNAFSNPKPFKLIRYFELIASSKDALILDFFAGSGTTLQATMQLNSEDGGRRRCILVTNNENNICETITYERNKRVIKGFTTPAGESVSGLPNNNLRYYVTDFISRAPSYKNKRKLVSVASDLLCIKEDIYDEKDSFGNYSLDKRRVRYFEHGDKRMLIICDESLIYDFIAEIREMRLDSKIKIYVFSDSAYAYEDDFAEVLDKVEVCALPAAILAAYKDVLPEQAELDADGNFIGVDLHPEESAPVWESDIPVQEDIEEEDEEPFTPTLF